MLNFTSLDNFFEFVLAGNKLEYNAGNMYLHFSYVDGKLIVQNVPFGEIIFVRSAFEQLFVNRTYKIINSNSQLTPKMQIALLILNYIKLQKIPVSNLKDILNNDISIDIKLETRDGNLKSGTIVFKQDNSISLTKRRALKNYYYDVLLS